ncbi:MAG: CaiB/BaiF CoA-transferase family protein [Kangiellaceae bacterium]|jgi:crotonobetainyl-CoA:carnitine CoA-transferase CaiB-like acyl-CoA transferase|nr:CaiB/BaiF CoA-transferase family protein [Kangiellaceae bacterium]
MNDIVKPFDGLLVVSIEQAVAAPLCSCQLAEGGARVIKIERHEGDFARKYDKAVNGESAYFVWANHGKDSLVMDFKQDDDAQLLHKLLEKADIFIQNLAPGACQRAGFGSEQLREKYPQLITCDITGYGDEGNYRDMKAYDFLVQCESGLVAINGAPEAYGRIGVSVCDIGAGMNALIGIQNALLVRSQTGKGSGVKVSLFDTAADWMQVPYLHAEYAGKAPERVGLHHPSIAPYGGYTTADNEILAISIQNEREWVNLCDKVLGDSNLAADPRFNNMTNRVANRKELDIVINKLFGNKTRAELETILKQAAIAYGAVNSVESLAKHPQLRTRKVPLQNGSSAEIIDSPIRNSFMPDGVPFGRVPKLGEHNEIIRSEFG